MMIEILGISAGYVFWTYCNMPGNSELSSDGTTTVHTTLDYDTVTLSEAEVKMVRDKVQEFLDNSVDNPVIQWYD